MENYRSLEAKRFFLDGWVQTVLHMKIEGDAFLMRSDLHPLYHIASGPHKP